jgi:hypothetical protein
MHFVLPALYKEANFPLRENRARTMCATFPGLAAMISFTLTRDDAALHPAIAATEAA